MLYDYLIMVYYGYHPTTSTTPRTAQHAQHNTQQKITRMTTLRHRQRWGRTNNGVLVRALTGRGEQRGEYTTTQPTTHI